MIPPGFLSFQLCWPFRIWLQLEVQLLLSQLLCCSSEVKGIYCEKSNTLWQTHLLPFIISNLHCCLKFLPNSKEKNMAFNFALGQISIPFFPTKFLHTSVLNMKNKETWECVCLEKQWQQLNYAANSWHSEQCVKDNRTVIFPDKCRNYQVFSVQIYCVIHYCQHHCSVLVMTNLFYLKDLIISNIIRLINLLYSSRLNPEGHWQCLMWCWLLFTVISTKGYFPSSAWRVQTCCIICSMDTTPGWRLLPDFFSHRKTDLESYRFRNVLLDVTEDISISEFVCDPVFLCINSYLSCSFPFGVQKWI